MTKLLSLVTAASLVACVSAGAVELTMDNFDKEIAGKVSLFVFSIASPMTFFYLYCFFLQIFSVFSIFKITQNQVITWAYWRHLKFKGMFILNQLLQPMIIL